MARPTPTPAQLSKEDVKYLERQLSCLPASKSDAGSEDADGLLKFGYHQNPYVRTFAKVLRSGFAIARNQLAEGHQRFTQARRDATPRGCNGAGDHQSGAATDGHDPRVGAAEGELGCDAAADADSLGQEKRIEEKAPMVPGRALGAGDQPPRPHVVVTRFHNLRQEKMKFTFLAKNSRRGN